MQREHCSLLRCVRVCLLRRRLRMGAGRCAALRSYVAGKESDDVADQILTELAPLLEQRLSELSLSSLCFAGCALRVYDC